MSRSQHHRRGKPRVEGFLPARRADAPLVAGPQSREAELRPWCRQVVARGHREPQEIGLGHHRSRRCAGRCPPGPSRSTRCGRSPSSGPSNTAPVRRRGRCAPIVRSGWSCAHPKPDCREAHERMPATLRPRRSALYMPASNPRAVEKARTLDCDVVILDLEDAVLPEAKDAARDAAVAAVRGGRVRLARSRGAGQRARHALGRGRTLRRFAGTQPDAVLAPKITGPRDVAAYASSYPGDDLGHDRDRPRAVFTLDAIAGATPRLGRPGRWASTIWRGSSARGRRRSGPPFSPRSR